MLKLQWNMDHLAAQTASPADLRQNTQYKAALVMAQEAALPDKGERPDRDPQVRCAALLSCSDC